MNHANAYKLFLLSAALAAMGGLSLLTGCKSSTSAAAVAGKIVGPPPRIQIALATPGTSMTSPLTDAAWQSTQWYLLVPPTNTADTTSQTRAAILYDANNLYVAFVSDKPQEQVSRDLVSVYLDTAGDGKDFVKIDENADASAPTCTWIRSTVDSDTREATAKASGGLDTAHPIAKIPQVTVKGMTASTQEVSVSGQKMWTTVVAIPLQSLPLPVRANAEAGAKWKLNLLRTTVTKDTGGGSEMLQSNLSPVYAGGQPVAPYRMAEMVLGAK